MNKVNNFFMLIGGILVIFVIGWSGLENYKRTLDDKLPIKIKQMLMKIQKKLPISLGRGLSLEQFEIKRNSAEIIIKSESNVLEKMSHKQATFRAQSMLCEWREQYLKQYPVTLFFTLIDSKDYQLQSVKNTQETCRDLPISLPEEYQT